jgi:lipoprotein-releasing system permease protein
MLKLKLAFRYFIRKPITLFAVASVLLGATAFVVVLGVMDGYVTAFNERSRMILSDMVIIGPGHILYPDRLMKEVVPRMEGEVVDWSPVIMGTAMAKIRRVDGTFSLKWCHFFGVDPAREYAVTHLGPLAQVPSAGVDWIIPGSDLLGAPSVENVTRIILVTSARDRSGPPLKAPLKPIAPVEFGLYQYDKEFAYIPRARAAELLSMSPDAATEIRIRIRDPRRSEQVQRRLKDELDRATGFPTYVVYRYQETNTMFRALKLQRALAAFVLICLFGAAGFAVVAICYMIVLQKTRDIGVLRTIGLSRGGVMSAFVAYGVTVGLSGVLLGIGLGVFILSRLDWVRATLTSLLGHDPFPVTLYSLHEVPHEVNAENILLIVAVAVVVSFLGSLYPAWRAARLNVVESLRYE